MAHHLRKVLREVNGLSTRKRNRPGQMLLVPMEDDAETNLECHLLVDTSASMAYPSAAHAAEAGRMSKLDYAICLAAALSLAAGSALAGNATKDEAQAMVKKGIAFIKANGPEKAYAEISNKSGQFVDRDDQSRPVHAVSIAAFQ